MSGNLSFDDLPVPAVRVKPSQVHGEVEVKKKTAVMVAYHFILETLDLGKDLKMLNAHVSEQDLDGSCNGFCGKYLEDPSPDERECAFI